MIYCSRVKKLIDKQATNILKGIAILLVIFGHLFVTQFLALQNPSFKYLGAQGVAIFLILSGYGLTQSFLNKGLDSSFLARRLRTVLLPYSLVTLSWIVIDSFYGKVYSFKTMLLSLVGFDLNLTLDATMWYISFILIWYLLFYFTFRLPFPNPLRVLLLFGYAYVFRYHIRFSFTEQVFWEWGLHAFMFPVGVLWAFFSSWFKIRKWMIYPLGIFAFVCFGFFLYNVRNNDLGLGPYMVSNFCFAFTIVAIVIILREFQLKFPLLRFIGSISYEIYLLEAVLMYKYSLLYLIPNKVFSLLFYLVGLIILSWGLQRLLAFKKMDTKITASGSI